jgi:Ca-activated chloride channel family protein
MNFIWPWMLSTLLLVPIFMGVYILLSRKRQRAAAELGPLGLVQSSSARVLGRQRHISPAFFTLGLAIIFFSLARPEIYVDLPKVEGTVILAFDVSNSMAADDLKPTRMEAAKIAARNFVENQPSTIEIGVVAFSHGGLVVVPPTNDQQAVLTAIERLSPQDATSLGQGIFTALNAISGEPLAVDPEDIAEGISLDIEDYSSSVILMLTDGENTSSPDPLLIAQLAAEAGVRIYPVGIGSEEGAVLQIDGFNILTRLNQETLQQIAGLTNGSYYHAEDEESLREIYENVDLQLTISGEKMEVTAILAGLSLLFLFIGGSLSLLWFGRMPL